MLDEKDLRAIAELMYGMEARQDKKLEELEARIDEKMARQRRDIMAGMKVLLDTEVTTKFNLLAEGIEDILRRMPSEEDMDIIDGRLDALETTVKQHSVEIAALKKAQ